MVKKLNPGVQAKQMARRNEKFFKPIKSEEEQLRDKRIDKAIEQFMKAITE